MLSQHRKWLERHNVQVSEKDKRAMVENGEIAESSDLVTYTCLPGWTSEAASAGLRQMCWLRDGQQMHGVREWLQVGFGCNHGSDVGLPHGSEL